MKAQRRDARASASQLATASPSRQHLLKVATGVGQASRQQIGILPRKERGISDTAKSAAYSDSRLSSR